VISTVTISTVTTIITSGSFILAAGILVSLFLSVFLASRYLLEDVRNAKGKLVGKYLAISIVPLCIGFGILVAVKIAEILAQ
jgi:hypothetical protein